MSHRYVRSQRARPAASAACVAGTQCTASLESRKSVETGEQQATTDTLEQGAIDHDMQTYNGQLWSYIKLDGVEEEHCSGAHDGPAVVAAFGLLEQNSTLDDPILVAKMPATRNTSASPK